MDNSEQYQKMCEKAEEIQREWKMADWDWVYCRGSKQAEVLSGYEVDGGFYGHSSEPECDNPVSNGAFRRGERIFLREHFWLPRQDQLQILSGLSWYLFDKTCVTWATTNSDYQRESKEIVGLRVVMYTLHKKQWDGIEWKEIAY